MCKNCGCGGQPDIDYKDLGNLTGGADECFKIAKGNSFCGNMILMDFGNGRCYCRGIGKESSCNKKQLPGRNASVYQSGMQANAIKNNKKFATVSIIPFKTIARICYIFSHLVGGKETTTAEINTAAKETTICSPRFNFTLC